MGIYFEKVHHSSLKSFWVPVKMGIGPGIARENGQRRSLRK
jgi:hypothetical protein